VPAQPLQEKESDQNKSDVAHHSLVHSALENSTNKGQAMLTRQPKNNSEEAHNVFKVQ
jgi:hypothetical protein